MKNTEECANIHLVSTRTQKGIADRSEFCVDGGFYKKNGIFYVTYKEHTDTGLNGTHTFLKISDNSVIIRRMGDFKTIINYEEGKICDFVYESPYGKMDIKIKTTKIVNKLSENGGILKIFYTMLAGSEDIQNEITLDITPRSEENEI